MAAGTFFLRKYRGELDDLNVFPVPDGDTGSNMYLTARAALAELHKVRSGPLSAVAAAAAHGSLLGARGNSGVILSQMLRGFAHNVRHRTQIDTLDIALAMKEAVGAARAALGKPVEGTIITVAGAAADAAFALCKDERDVLRLGSGIVRAAADALERTPEQLPVLKEAGVVDSGGAGFVYFLEGILRFLPDAKSRATAFPRRPARKRSFMANHTVAGNKFCTEFVLEETSLENHALRDLLAAHGDSLLVVGAAPTLRVHIHTADPKSVTALAGEHGCLSREKVEDMERQHRLLVVDAPSKPFSVVAVVSGDGFATIARELGAESVVVARDANPSVRELLLAVNACLSERVYLLANDPNVALAASEAAGLAERDTVVVPTRDVPSGFSALLALSAGASALPDAGRLLAAGTVVRVAEVFFAGKDSLLGGVALRRGAPAASVDGVLLAAASVEAAVALAVARLGAGANEGGLLTLYYGGIQKERDARALVTTLTERFPGTEVEYYYGGQQGSEYVISFER